MSMLTGARHTLDRPHRGNAHLRWDMRRDVPRAELRDLEDRMRQDPVRPLSTSPPPDPEAWAGGLARGVVEILHGLRPLAQLRRWVVPDLYDLLASMLPGDRGPQVVAGSCHVLSTHVCPIREGVVEVAVVVRAGSRTRAIALRLEDFRGRWLTTALDVA